MKKINFLAVSDSEKYDMFVLPFILSSLFHVENSSCEIYVKSKKDFIKNNKKGLDILNRYFPKSFIIHSIPDIYFSGKIKYPLIGQIVRFLELPIIQSKYTYIGDIDIMNSDSNIVQIHEELMEKQELPYSNIVRPNSERLTGCMFVENEKYYPKLKKVFKQFKENPDSIYKPILNDEILLHHLVKKVHKLPKFNTGDFRPIHGIHMSLNRKNPLGNKEFGIPSWGINQIKLDKYNLMRESIVYKEIYPYLYDDFKTLIMPINDIKL